VSDSVQYFCLGDIDVIKQFPVFALILPSDHLVGKHPFEIIQGLLRQLSIKRIK
jgi:hypothetical protein